MILYSVFNDGKSKSGAAGFFGMALINTVETFKYTALMFGCNADARVLYGYNCMSVILTDFNFNLAAVYVVTDSIIAKIINNLVNIASNAENGLRFALYNKFNISLCRR